MQELILPLSFVSFSLSSSEGNVKALYRRAKAYAACWDFSNARKDFKMALELDPSLGAAIRKELRLLDDAEKQKDDEDRVKMKVVFERYSEWRHYSTSWNDYQVMSYILMTISL